MSPRSPILLALLAALCAGGLLPVPARADWTARGQFQYRDRDYGPQGFTGTTDRPVRYALVEVMDATTAALLASTSTDSTGGFSIRVTDGATRNVLVRCLARSADNTPYHIQVLSSISNGLLYSMTGATVASHSPTADVEFNSGRPMVADPANVGAAFNILDVLVNGADFLGRVNHGVLPFPLLTVYWNLSSQDGTYFDRGGLAIHLTGDDGYGDPVIQHEQGHYAARVYSRDDNPGGSHYLGDNHQPVALSFSEGWASFFGQSVRRYLGLPNPAYYCDLMGTGASPGLNFCYELETPSIHGEGAGSEIAVQASLWDIVDDASVPDPYPGVDDDPLALGFETVWDVMRNGLPTAPDRATLESFWDSWFGRGLGNQPGMIETFQRATVEFYPDASEPDGSPTLARSIPSDGTPVHHTLYPSRDADWARFNALAEHHYVIETTGLVGGTNTQLQLFALADTSTYIAFNTNRGSGDPSSRIDFDAVAGGDYLVRVVQVPGDARYGSYDLRVTEGQPSATQFLDVSAAAGVAGGTNARGMAWGDYDNDGYPDLYICYTGRGTGEGAPDSLFHNERGVRFSNVTAAKGVRAGIEQHEGAAWGD